MNKITINEEEYELTTETLLSKKNCVYYKDSWYKPVEQFKVGQWVTTVGFANKYTLKIYDITSTKVYHKNYGYGKNSVKLATEQEILEQLRKEAKEKGLIKGSKVCRLTDNIANNVFVTIVQEDDNYYSEDDTYAKSGIILYKNGKWVEKVEPLFTTEDGKEIYDGNKVYWVTDSLSIEQCNWSKEGNSNFDCNKYFSSEKLAQEYINKNKPKEWKILEVAFKRSFKPEIRNVEGYSDEYLEALLKCDNKIHSIKRISDGEIFTIGDKVKQKNVIHNNTFIITKFELDVNKEHFLAIGNGGIRISKIEKVTEPKLMFGGYECSFKVKLLGDYRIDNNSTEYSQKTVEITCKGETGTHWQIEEILKNYFRPCKFGNVRTKSFKLTSSITYQNGQIDVINPKYDINNVEEVKIGCITGKYGELVDIYNHCLTLLK